MSALTIYQKLETTMKAIEGIRLVVLGDPRTIQASPMLIIAYASFTHPMKNHPPARNMVGFLHNFTIRLAIEWEENPQAEMQLLTLVDQIPQAIDADPHLSGALTRGLAQISDAACGFAVYSNKKYRVADYSAAIREKFEGT